MIQSITLRRRESTFRVLSCSGSRDNQCGRAGTNEFAYRVEITTDPVVDERGFIIDSLTVKGYFEMMYADVAGELPSCERIAMRACEDLALLTGDTCQRVEVEVGTDALAGLSAVWVRNTSHTNDFPPSGETLS